MILRNAFIFILTCLLWYGIFYFFTNIKDPFNWHIGAKIPYVILVLLTYSRTEE